MAKKNIIFRGCQPFTICCLLFTILFAGCTKNNRTVIKVGSEKITVHDIKERIRDLPPKYKDFLHTDVGTKQLVDLIIRERIVVQIAKKQGIDKRKDIKESVENFKKDYNRRMKEFEDNLLASSLLKEIQEQKFTPAETDLQRYYSSHKDEFQSPVEIRISHILLTTEKDAAQVLSKLRSGESFSNLAREFSIDPNSNVSGGDLGSFKYSELFPEFQPVLKKLAIGEVSNPVRTTFGYHIIKKADEKRLPSQSYEGSKPSIRQILIKDKFDEWINQKKIELGVNINQDVLKKSVSGM